jgi:tetratricopeptide (TPR) repeat protein
LGNYPPAQALIARGQSRLRIANESDLKDLEAKKVEANNFTHLGDNRLRQGRIQEALEAYQKAVDIYQRLLQGKLAVQLTSKNSPLDLPAVTDAHSKLAHVYLRLGDNDRAFATLKAATTLTAPVPQAVTSGGAVASSAVLPEKLFISVTRSMLEQVGTAKLSFEDFKKNAAVEHLTFPAADKPATKSSAGSRAKP